MTSWLQSLTPQLELRQQQNLYRQRLQTQSAQGTVVDIDDQQLLNFSSNDYLGLANHPDVVNAFKNAVDSYGVGAGASHLVVGHHRLHHQLETALAKFTGRDRAVLFSSGYMANLGVIQALLGKRDFIVQDKLNHASLIDAGLDCGAKMLRYKHNDITHLQQLLGKNLPEHGAGEISQRRLLAVDGVFSMDGDIAPLPQLLELCEQYQLALMVDDAHGFGVLGEHGGGCAEHFNLSQTQLPIVMGTLGKAFGVSGAFVAGSHALIETLVQFSRSYIYTTALPPACAAAAYQSLQLLQQPERRIQLRKSIAQFRDGIATLCIPLGESSTAIQPLIVGSSEQALALSNALFEAGILVTAIRPPTVPVGTARLRVALSAAHSSDHIDQLLNALDHALKKQPVILR